jgi:hypothetical protein
MTSHEISQDIPGQAPDKLNTSIFERNQMNALSFQTNRTKVAAVLGGE